MPRADGAVTASELVRAAVKSSKTPTAALTALTNNQAGTSADAKADAKDNSR